MQKFLVTNSVSFTNAAIQGERSSQNSLPDDGAGLLNIRAREKSPTSQYKGLHQLKQKIRGNKMISAAKRNSDF